MKRGSYVRIAPSAVLLLAALVLLSSPQLILAMLAAAVCHEWGHYWVLRHFGGDMGELTVTAGGMEMHMTGQQLSYGEEILAVLAGPAVNLLLAVLLGAAGHWWEALYLFAGAQLVLGLFNLIPAGRLDGGTLLWLAVAWRSDPFLADRISGVVNALAAAITLAAAICLWCRGGSPFLLLAAALLFCTDGEKRLVKQAFSR